MTVAAPLHPQEEARMRLLEAYAILDSAPDPSFDRVTRLAADLLKAPAVAVSLIDRDRQWLKASCGIDVDETPRDVAFCAHAILSPGPLLVRDTGTDDRFKDNPLVTGPMRIRTYVGIPLRPEGALPLGTLCVFYTEVTDVRDEDVALLGKLAEIVSDLLRSHRLRETSRQRAEVLEDLRAEMRVQLDLMESMSRSTKTGGWWFDTQTNELHWTAETYRIHGMEPGTPVDVDMAIGFYSDEHRSLIARHVERCLSEGVAYDAELTLHPPGGAKRSVRTIGKPRFGEDGSVVQVYGAFQDITAETARRAELLQQREAAEAASRAKDDFLAAVSHEIRTPMNGILGMLELARAHDLPEAQAERIRLAHESAEALLTVLNDILDCAKINAGTLTLVSEPVEIERLVRDTSRLFTPAAQEKGLVLDVRVEDGIPPSILGDAVRIQQVLTNLTSNALKFTDSGAVSIEVGSCEIDGAPALCLAVQDTGPGIPEDRLGALFKRFSQVDMSLSRRHAGTGLGLAICKSLVNTMGGQIGVTSKEGKGSRFWFSLPARIPERTTVVPEGERAVTCPPLRILLAEDHPVNRMVTEAICAAAGHTVTVAEDGFEAVELFQPGAFDVVLMDMQMPGLDGIEATKRIRAAWPEDGTSIIAVTANVLEKHRELCLAAGMNGFLTKPLKARELEEKLAAQVQRRGLGDVASGIAAG